MKSRLWLVVIGLFISAEVFAPAHCSTTLTVEDGRFCINGEPTKLVGWNLNIWGGEGGAKVEAEITGQLKTLSEYGFNAIRLCNAHMILPLMMDEANPEEPPLLGIRKIVEKCDELGMVVMMTPLHLVYFGCGKVGEDLPKLFGINCLHEMYFDESARKRFLRVYEHNAKALADYNNIMWAPPNEQNPGFLFDEGGRDSYRGEYKNHTEEHWIMWLKNRYGTVSALKEAWGKSTPDIEQLPDDWEEVAEVYMIDFPQQKFSSLYPINSELEKMQRDRTRFRPDALDFLSGIYYGWVKDIAETVRKYNPDWIVIDGGDHPVYPSNKALVNHKRRLLREGIIQGMTQHCINSWLLFFSVGPARPKDGWLSCPEGPLPLVDTGGDAELELAIRALPFVHLSEWALFKANGGVVFADEGIDPFWEAMTPPLLINSRYVDGDLNWAWHGSAGHEWANGKDGFEQGRDYVEQFYVNTLHGYPSVIQKEKLYWWLALTEFCQYEDWHEPAPDVLIVLNPQKPNYHRFVVPLVQMLNRSNVSYSTTQIDEFTKEELYSFKLIIYIAENQNLSKVREVFKQTAECGKTRFLILGDGTYDDGSVDHGCFGPWQGKFFFKNTPSLNRRGEETPQEVQIISSWHGLKKNTKVELKRLGYEWIAFDINRLEEEVLGRPKPILQWREKGKRYSPLVVSENTACLGTVPVSISPQDKAFIDYESIMRAICRWAGIEPEVIKDYIQIPKANGLGIFARPEPEGESKIEFPSGIDLVKSIMQFEKVPYSSPVVLKGYDYKILLPENIDVVGYPYAQKNGVFAISQTNSFKSFEVNEENIQFKTTGPDTTTAEIAVYDIPFPVSSVTLDGKPLSKEKSWKIREDNSLLISFYQTGKSCAVTIQ